MVGYQTWEGVSHHWDGGWPSLSLKTGLSNKIKCINLLPPPYLEGLWIITFRWNHSISLLDIPPFHYQTSYLIIIGHFTTILSDIPPHCYYQTSCHIVIIRHPATLLLSDIQPHCYYQTSHHIVIIIHPAIYYPTSSHIIIRYPAILLSDIPPYHYKTFRHVSIGHPAKLLKDIQRCKYRICRDVSKRHSMI